MGDPAGVDGAGVFDLAFRCMSALMPQYCSTSSSSCAFLSGSAAFFAAICAVSVATVLLWFGDFFPAAGEVDAAGMALLAAASALDMTPGGTPPNAPSNPFHRIFFRSFVMMSIAINTFNAS